LNKWADYKDSTGAFRGRIVDISDAGNLIVIRENGKEKQYGFKEIALNDGLCNLIAKLHGSQFVNNHINKLLKRPLRYHLKKHVQVGMQVNIHL